MSVKAPTFSPDRPAPRPAYSRNEDPEGGNFILLQDKNAQQLQDRKALSSEDKSSFSVEDRASSLTPEDRKILRERVERVLSGQTNESLAQVKDI